MTTKNTFYRWSKKFAPSKTHIEIILAQFGNWHLLRLCFEREPYGFHKCYIESVFILYKIN